MLVHILVMLRALIWTAPAVLCRTLFGTPYPEGKNGPAASPAPSPPSGEASARPYLMMLSFIEWDGAWQRPQHLASHLASVRSAGFSLSPVRSAGFSLFPGEMDVVCCAPVRAHNALLRAIGLLFSARETSAHGLAGLTILRPLVLPFENRFSLLRRLNHLILFDCLQREMRRRGAVPEVLLTNSPFFAPVFSCLPARLRAYDIMDEMTRSASAPPNAAELEKLLVAQCDLVTAGTLSVSRLKSSLYAGLVDGVRYVPCGVDAYHFASSQSDAAPPPDIARLSKPVIGFFGAINERVDPEVLDTLAREMPGASIALIGPVYRRFPALGDRPNVHFLGLKPYADLPRYLAAFDCAIIPYRLTEGIEFVQPVKALEYLAGGKPVVSTNIPDVAELYRDTVRIGKDPADFSAKVREAIAEGPARAAEYRLAASGRGWEDMAREFMGLLRDTAARKLARPLAVTHLLHGAHFGGAEGVVIALCRAHQPERCRASILCLGNGKIVQDRIHAASIPAAAVEMRGKTDLAVVFPVIARLRAWKTGVIHTHTSRTNLVGRLISRLSGIPVVTTVHTAVARDINDFGRSNRLNAWIERRTQRWSEILLTVSAHNRREIVRTGMPEDRVVHVPNGVPLMFSRPAAGELDAARREFPALGAGGPIVGMLASMRPRKGAEVLLRAFPAIAREFPGARLLMVGSGEFVESTDYLQTLKSLAMSLGIPDRVVFTGHRDDTTLMLALMDLVVLPSLFGEGLPLVILEAMALGKPVVASRTEGNDEAVRDGVNGLLSPAGDDAPLSEAILSLLRDPVRARAMGEEGRRIAEAEYDIAIMARRYEAAYSRVTER